MRPGNYFCPIKVRSHLKFYFFDKMHGYMNMNTISRPFVSKLRKYKLHKLIEVHILLIFQPQNNSCYKGWVFRITNEIMYTVYIVEDTVYVPEDTDYAAEEPYNIPD